MTNRTKLCRPIQVVEQHKLTKVQLNTKKSGKLKLKTCKLGGAYSWPQVGLSSPAKIGLFVAFDGVPCSIIKDIKELYATICIGSYMNVTKTRF